MNIILLSGGSGKRLWPLSNEVRSKQFLKIFKTEQNEYESMIQRVYHQIKRVDQKGTITIATSKVQVSAIQNQLGEKIEICAEPYRKDTFPAIALAVAYLHDKKKISKEEVVVVCPVDPYVELDYFETLKELERIAKKGDANLVLMGIEPTYPSEKYGYIIPEKKETISRVMEFKEKPTQTRAEEYLSCGALWNGGVFAFRIDYLLKKVQEEIGFSTYFDLYRNYSSLKKISFDYAVTEQEQQIQVIRFTGKWKDLGTWNTLTEAMEESLIGNTRINENCKNVHIINELEIPILCMGLQNIVISASPDGILVSSKEESSYIKPYVDSIHQQVMFAEKSWGTYRVLDVEKESLTIKTILKPGEKMNYHSHNKRDEIWAIIDGKGRAYLDGIEQIVSTGDIVRMQAGCCHTIIADTELKMIEIQLGKEISSYDKQKVVFQKGF